MGQSASTPDLGRLIWETPPAQPAPRLFGYLLAAGLLGLAIALAFPVSEMFSDTASAGLLGVGFLLALLGGAFWVFKNTAAGKAQLGDQFFERGIEFGPMKNRRRIPYADLESIRLEEIPSADRQLDAAFTVVRAAASVMSGNPAGLGYAMGKLNAPQVEIIAVVKPHGEREFRVELLTGATSRLGPILGFSPQKRDYLRVDREFNAADLTADADPTTEPPNETAGPSESAGPAGENADLKNFLRGLP